MTDFEISRARLEDVPELVRLLGASVPDCSPQTVWELPWMWHHYHVARSADGEIVGAASIQPAGRARAEVRGLTVAPSWRGRGVARALLGRLIERAERSGADLVCMTRSPELFLKFGFLETAPHWTDPRRRPCGPAEKPDSPRIAMSRHAETSS